MDVGVRRLPCLIRTDAHKAEDPSPRDLLIAAVAVLAEGRVLEEINRRNFGHTAGVFIALAL